MTFFFDNNLSQNLVDGLKAFGEDVLHLKEVFEDNEQDTVWLKYIGDKKFFLVTRDEHVRFNPIELQTLKQHNVGAFFIGGKNLSRCAIIQQVVRNWPRVKEFSAKTKLPFLYRIPPSGTKFVRLEI
jgi:predicted nuclease of predicted toxin-antitoxin system